MIITKLNALVPGMHVKEDVYAKNGSLLIRKGSILTKTHIQYLKQFNIEKVEVEDQEESLDNLKSKVSSVRLYKHRDEKVTDEDSLEYIHALLKEEISNNLKKALKKLVKIDQNTKTLHDPIEKIIIRVIQDKNVLDFLQKILTIGDSSLYHCLQVAVLSLAIGMQLKMDLYTLKKLAIASLLYDIGKWYLDKTVLFKEENLNKEEFDIIKEHTIIGNMVLREAFDEEISLVALQHHERFNGTGYPHMLHNDQIHIFSRIVAVVDVYISLINNRPYRKKFLPHEAIEFILGSGGLLFDPDVVNCFIKTVSVYYNGSIVELNNGCIGIVKRVERNPLGRPVIEILYDENKRLLDDPILVDLSEDRSLFIMRELDA